MKIKKRKEKEKIRFLWAIGKVHNSGFPRLSNFVHSHHKLANLNTNSVPDKENHSEKEKFFFNDLKENKTGKKTFIFFRLTIEDGMRWGGGPEIMKLCFKIK